jgi:uncharacterized protein (DUF1778 family)
MKHNYTISVDDAAMDMIDNAADMAGVSRSMFIQLAALTASKQCQIIQGTYSSDDFLLKSVIDSAKYQALQNARKPWKKTIVY